MRERLERGLGAGLTAVRVHTGPAADGLARALRADAFACGSDIYFRDGAYQPRTAAGLRLLAHEAAHVVQQARGQVTGPAVSSPGDAAERAADRAAGQVLAGLDWAGRDGDRVEVWPGPSRVVQRHVSFEHRLLGDGPTADLVRISQRGSGWEQLVRAQIGLLELWAERPLDVTEADVTARCPWIRTLRLGRDRLLVTYGEVNALPDYLADAGAVDTVDPAILLPVLQVIRQEGYNELSQLLTGLNPKRAFAGAACEPWPLSLVNAIMETRALEQLTDGLGPGGQDHYQGLLSRNACHFAPFSWYRWQASHVIARDLAKQAFDRHHDDSLTRQAWAASGYADHFLEDSFSAGHLVNKALVMQWFIEWAAEVPLLPVADWDAVKEMTDILQPRLQGAWLYPPGEVPLRVSNDPQTVQEVRTLAGRIIASGISGDGLRARTGAYQNYLTFLGSAAAQLAAATLHDHYNEASLWVASPARQQPYEIWGDNTLFTGANGGEGVQATSEAAQLSQQAISEILSQGETSVTTEQIIGHFPAQVGRTTGSLELLRDWNSRQRDFCRELFASRGQILQDLFIRLSAPRLGVTSQDQEFTPIWSANLQLFPWAPVWSVFLSGRLFCGCDGSVYELSPANGKILRTLRLTGDTEGGLTRLSGDDTHLYAGVHGEVFAISLASWTLAWRRPVAGFRVATVLAADGHLWAAAAGYVYELAPASGEILRLLRLTDDGGDDNRMDVDSTYLFAGMHGHAYAIARDNWDKPAWQTRVGGALSDGPVFVRRQGDSLYTGSDAHVCELDPVSGHVRHELKLDDDGGDTRLALSDTHLFVGTPGRVHGIRFDDWKQVAWQATVSGGRVPFESPVNLTFAGGQLFAGAAGHVYQLDPDTGTVRHERLLTYRPRVGDFQTGVAVAGQVLIASVAGDVNRMLVRENPLPSGPVLLASQPATGWAPFAAFPRTPDMSSVFGVPGNLGNTEMFGIGADGTLYHNWMDRSGSWHGWEPGFRGAPRVVSIWGMVGVTGHTEMFGIGADGTLYHNWMDGSGYWRDWQPDFGGAPKVVSVSGVRSIVGHTELFATSPDGILYHNWMDGSGTWHDWQSGFLGAPRVSSVSGADAGGGTELVAVALNGDLWRNRMDRDGSWQQWEDWTPGRESPSSKVTVESAFVVAGQDRTDVLAITRPGPVLRSGWDASGQRYPWSAEGVQFSAVTGIPAGTSGATELFAVGSSGSLYYQSYGPGSPPQDWQSDFPPGSPAMIWQLCPVRGANGQTQLFAVAAQ